MTTALENVFYNNASVTIGSGCTVEYNMNSMIDGITVTTTISDSSYIGQVSGITLKYNPYKKLFPIDSIVKPFRPLFSGVKYYVLLPADYNNTNFSAFRTIKYPGEGVAANDANAEPRIYYPGVSTNYKYWLTAAGQGVNATVTYKHDNSSWLQAGQTGTPPVGNKYALANKIVVRFEKNHQIPNNYSFIITPKDGSAVTYGPFTTPTSGNIEHYYNGTNWNSTTEPNSFATPIEIKSITLTSSAPDSGRVIGVIELSARWIKDISSDIVSFDVSKESSSNGQDILPVGFVTANSLSISLLKYDQSELKYLEYNRTSSSIDNSKIYMLKNPELKPYIKVYHSAATYVPGEYDIVKQGSYYIDTWTIDQYGETRISALDNSKYLMETFAPEIVCDNYPITAILRHLLDSVGLTNYNFNVLTDPLNSATSIDTSIPTIRYWWTEDTKSVWECIQELCRDFQITALFDDNNILQFYSRDYLYNKYQSDKTTLKDPRWTFYYDEDGSIKPNIVSFNKKEIAAGNWVRVLWQSPISSNYTGASSTLWQVPSTLLVAGGLGSNILENQTITDINESKDGFRINLSTIDTYSKFQSIFNFNGYLMSQSEIFEYDAVEYQYVPLGSTKPYQYVKVWITSSSDVSKYNYMSEPGYEDPTKPETAFFRPTGKIRIKSRAALGTSAQNHLVAGTADTLSSWHKRTVEWKV